MVDAEASAELLAHIAAGDVGWSKVGRGISYRRWLPGDRDYELVTVQVSVLVAMGWARNVPGGRYAAGPVELTPAGRALLA